MKHPQNLKAYLGQLSRVELTQEIVRLSRIFPPVAAYYAIRLSPTAEQDLFDRYRALIAKEFQANPKARPGPGRLSVARKAVLDYKRLNPSAERLADLMLSYVEAGVKYTDAYGDIDEAFYNSMESMYEQFLKLANEQRLLGLFAQRAKRVVTDTQQCGWGFPDSLSYLYEQYYPSL